MASTLRKGSSGSEVKKLQQALNSAGYNLNVDGIFGDKTLNAVTNYQKKNGLGVDGIVGSQTWGKLTGGSSSSTAATSPTTTNTQTAVTPLGNTYNPDETTATKADLTAIEGASPTFTESQAYKDAMSALQQHQSAKPGEYQSTFNDRLNSLYEQIAGRGEYQSQYADQMAGLADQIAGRGEYESEYADAIKDALNQYQNTQYESPYASRIEELYDQVMNRGDFSYDFNADPLYQQYKDQYMQGGQRAMQDTMAEAAALTGGYGNSYASTAGNLAYQQYLSGLNDVIPELQQQAYERYANEGDELLNRLTLTQGLDETAYGRHNDAMNKLLQQIQTMQGLDESAYGRYQDAGTDLYNRLSALQSLDQDAYGRYSDATNELYNQLSATQGLEQDAYNKYRDQVGDYYTDLEYLTGVAGDQYNRDYTAYEDALNKYLTDRDYYYGKSQDELAQASTSSGGSGSGGSKTYSTDDGNTEEGYQEPEDGDQITLREYSDALNEIMAATGSADAVREAAEDLQARYSITGSEDKKKQALLYAMNSTSTVSKTPASKTSTRFQKTAMQ